ncbi:MAG TPA: proton-conducting transporter membrane subunit [Candidatus Margulisiibacteriota bacterium]|nr:proton-conducting transporter membrane subunit [Candidatus Margulisiibacteriota bacterium]
MLYYLVLIPLCAAFLTAVFAKWRKPFGCLLAILTALILFFSSLGFCHAAILHKAIIYRVGGWAPPLGICLVVDGLSGFMLVIVNTVSLLVMLYAFRYMQRFTDKWKFYALFMLMLAGMNGVIISGDMFNLYVFMELASLSAYCLVAFGTKAEDLEAAFKYAIMGSLASLFILLGIALLYSHASTLNMADMAVALSGRPSGVLLVFVTVLFLAGFGMKAALVPFHAWLADAHSSAPAPVSATLSGVFIKTLGIYALLRVFFNVIGISSQILSILALLGIISMALGAFLAIAQDDIKRMFAYSSISQVGYIVFALGIGTPLAILGGLFHLFNHAVFKPLLFMDAGAIEYSTGRRSLSGLGGLNTRLPFTGSTSLIASLGISGIPPLGGFWSKLFIIMAAAQAGYFGMAAIAALISIVTLAYYFKFQTIVFSGAPDTSLREIKEVPLTMKAPMLVLGLICILSGLLLLPAFKPFLQAAIDSLRSGIAYKDTILR